MKLNLGCGFNHHKDYINVDKFTGCQPDEIVDLEKTPWPWASDSAAEIRMSHVLEHLGHKPDDFLAIVAEVYRVLQPNGLWQIAVPHPRHDDFMADPTHIRPITKTTMEMFDLEKNKEWVAAHFSSSPLAIMTKVDFVLEYIETKPDQVWINRLARNEVQEAELNQLVWHNNNIGREIFMTLRARKPFKMD